MMKVYTYSEARQHLADVLNTARREEVIIRRKGGDTFSLSLKKTRRSPFDVPGLKTRVKTRDILLAIREVRARQIPKG